MAQVHSDTVNAAIRVLAREGVSGKEIWRRLSAGTAGLKAPVGIGLRTVQVKAARYREELRAESDPIQDADEIDTADAIQRDNLRTARAECSRLNERVRQGKATSKDAVAMRQWVRTVSEIGDHFSARSASREPPSRHALAGKARHRSLSSETTLEKLATQMAEDDRRGANEQRKPAPKGVRPTGNGASSANGAEQADGTREARPSRPASE